MPVVAIVADVIVSDIVASAAADALAGTVVADAVGATGTAALAGAAGGAVAGGANAAVTGGDVLKGIETGGVSGGVTGGISNVLSGTQAGDTLGQAGTTGVSRAVGSTTNSLLQGQSLGQALKTGGESGLVGGLATGISGGVNSLLTPSPQTPNVLDPNYTTNYQTASVNQVPSAFGQSPAQFENFLTSNATTVNPNVSNYDSVLAGLTPQTGGQYIPDQALNNQTQSALSAALSPYISQGLFGSQSPSYSSPTAPVAGSSPATAGTGSLALSPDAAQGQQKEVGQNREMVWNTDSLKNVLGIS